LAYLEKSIKVNVNTCFYLTLLIKFTNFGAVPIWSHERFCLSRQAANVVNRALNAHKKLKIAKKAIFSLHRFFLSVASQNSRCATQNK
jgi:hypothetical protein